MPDAIPSIAQRYDDPHELEITGDDRCRRHTKRLEGCDLLALRGDKPAQGDIEKERGDGEATVVDVTLCWLSSSSRKRLDD